MTADAAAITEQLLADRPDGVRADARRNLYRLVVAAREAVDEVGLRASSHEIAGRAGVGIGTFYRQVASLDELLSLIVDGLLEQLVRAAEAAVVHPDPWVGFSEFAAAWVGLCTSSKGVADAIEGLGAPELDPALIRIRLRLHRLVRHTQRAGVLRTDTSWRDVASLLHCLNPAEITLGEVRDPDQWRRNLSIVLAGLHA
ncbi:MAG TPA: TetR/AcrR family transcriptional regulator [Pseudonocardia sp.]|jgi:AcrR family transcriptional regulator|nr:TetR/AcrR family transcriptional regulator [Pseudonocardia sp.]